MNIVIEIEMVQMRVSTIKAKVLSPSQGMGTSTNAMGKCLGFEQAREMKFVGRRLCEKSSDFADPCWVKQLLEPGNFTESVTMVAK